MGLPSSDFIRLAKFFGPSSPSSGGGAQLKEGDVGAPTAKPAGLKTALKITKKLEQDLVRIYVTNTSPRFIGLRMWFYGFNVGWIKKRVLEGLWNFFEEGKNKLQRPDSDVGAETSEIRENESGRASAEASEAGTEVVQSNNSELAAGEVGAENAEIIIEEDHTPCTANTKVAERDILLVEDKLREAGFFFEGDSIHFSEYEQKSLEVILLDLKGPNGGRMLTDEDIKEIKRIRAIVEGDKNAAIEGGIAVKNITTWALIVLNVLLVNEFNVEISKITGASDSVNLLLKGSDERDSIFPSEWIIPETENYPLCTAITKVAEDDIMFVKDKLRDAGASSKLDSIIFGHQRSFKEILSDTKGPSGKRMFTDKDIKTIEKIINVVKGGKGTDPESGIVIDPKFGIVIKEITIPALIALNEFLEEEVSMAIFEIAGAGNSVRLQLNRSVSEYYLREAKWIIRDKINRAHGQ
ncbi:MAG: hypothetical protein LBB14_01410 [Puniceicoccales bacterium]|nr:hypothetical protein [Puniceicoccales bacterium]